MKPSPVSRAWGSGHDHHRRLGLLSTERVEYYFEKVDFLNKSWVPNRDFELKWAFKKPYLLNTILGKTDLLKYNLTDVSVSFKGKYNRNYGQVIEPFYLYPL